MNEGEKSRRNKDIPERFGVGFALRGGRGRWVGPEGIPQPSAERRTRRKLLIIERIRMSHIGSELPFLGRQVTVRNGKHFGLYVAQGSDAAHSTRIRFGASKLKRFRRGAEQRLHQRDE